MGKVGTRSPARSSRVHPPQWSKCRCVRITALMSLGVRPTPRNPFIKRLGTRPSASFSRSLSLEPTPVSTRTFFPWICRTMQFNPRVIRFLRSVLTEVSQSVLGTCPNTDPPSSFTTPSLITFTPVFIPVHTLPFVNLRVVELRTTPEPTSLAPCHTSNCFMRPLVQGL